MRARTHSPILFRSALAATLLALSPAAGLAAPVFPAPTKPHFPGKLPTPKQPLKPVPSPSPSPSPSSPGSTIRHAPKTTGLKSAQRSPASTPHDTSRVGYALSSFLLRHPKGTDHESRHIAVMPQGSTLDVALGDNDGNDPFEYRVMHEHVHVTTQPLEVRRTGCRFGSCQLTYPTRPDTVFVLAGFELRRKGGDDNVREIGIMPAGAGRIDVVYHDDQKVKREFDVTIRYHLIPRSEVHDEGEVTGRNTRPYHDHGSHYGNYLGEQPHTAEILRIPRPVFHLDYTYGVGIFARRATATAVLQGFNMRFHNSDHHLGALGIELGGHGSEEVVVWFNDQNFDDQYDVRVRYALVDPVY